MTRHQLIQALYSFGGLTCMLLFFVDLRSRLRAANRRGAWWITAHVGIVIAAVMLLLAIPATLLDW